MTELSGRKPLRKAVDGRRDLTTGNIRRGLFTAVSTMQRGERPRLESVSKSRGQKKCNLFYEGFPCARSPASRCGPSTQRCRPIDSTHMQLLRFAKDVLARSYGELDRSGQSPDLHLSGEERYDPNPQAVQAHRVHHRPQPDLPRPPPPLPPPSSIPVKNSSPRVSQHRDEKYRLTNAKNAWTSLALFTCTPMFLIRKSHKDVHDLMSGAGLHAFASSLPKVEIKPRALPSDNAVMPTPISHTAAAHDRSLDFIILSSIRSSHVSRLMSIP